MATITKKDLVERIAHRTKLSRGDVKRTMQEMLDTIIHELKRGNRIEFRDFGVFEVKARAPRLAQNPKTLQKVEVPAKRAVKFKVGRLMRDSVEMIPASQHIAEVKPGTNGVHAPAAGTPVSAGG